MRRIRALDPNATASFLQSSRSAELGRHEIACSEAAVRDLTQPASQSGISKAVVRKKFVFRRQ
jgi:hypothetical protein